MIYALEYRHVNYSPPIWSFITYDFAEAVAAANLDCHWERSFFSTDWYPMCDMQGKFYHYVIREVDETSRDFTWIMYDALHPLDINEIPIQFRQEAA